MVNITPSSYDKGFTLVELAIALMVIGLLIGGVLKGQELIENAKVTSFIRQVKAYDAATLIFQNTYGALPGDIKRPNRIPNCTDEPCDIAGNGDGKVRRENSLSPQSIEIANFFPHLTKAGMIQGPMGGETADIPSYINTQKDNDLFLPETSLDQHLIMSYETNGLANYNNGHYYIIVGNSPPNTGNNLSVRQFIAIDSKLDDGKPFTGSVGLIEWGQCPIKGDTGSMEEYMRTEYDTESAYAQNHEECNIIIRTGF